MNVGTVKEQLFSYFVTFSSQIEELESFSNHDVVQNKQRTSGDIHEPSGDDLTINF
jgi:hypothetical protein